MKKRNSTILITGIILIIVLVLMGYLIYYQINNTKKTCNYNSEVKNYIGKSKEECNVIKFLCIQEMKPFTDECGCGCEKINPEPEKTYCTPEQKSAEVCPQYYSATCGWFNQSIKCLKYPCANTFPNPCFACANPSVDFYTNGECPK